MRECRLRSHDVATAWRLIRLEVCINALALYSSLWSFPSSLFSYPGGKGGLPGLDCCTPPFWGAASHRSNLTLMLIQNDDYDTDRSKQWYLMMKRISLMLMLILKADFYDLMVCFTKCPSSNLRNKIAGARAKVEASYRFGSTSLVGIVTEVHIQWTSL